ncbi:MAG: SpoIIE family protein phosphatase [Lysobacteraceae bacterium]
MPARVHAPLQLRQIGGPILAELPTLDRLCRIGRAAGADLLLPDPHVSRRHALIEPHGERLLLRDLGARGGTELNGQRIDPARPAALRAGDHLRIGPWLFALAAPAAEPMPDLALDEDGETLFQTLPGSATRADMAAFARFAARASACRRIEDLDRLLLDELRRRAELDGAVLLTPAGNGHGVHLVGADPPGAQPQALARRLLEQAAAGEPLLIDAAGNTSLRSTLVGLPPTGSVCVALREDGRAQAWLYGWRHGPLHPEAALGDYLRGLAELGQALRGGLLQRLALERHARLEADLQEAQAVQRRLLPPAAGELGALGHACLFRPGRSVSGDLLLLHPRADGGCRFLLGDVAGSGAGAGLLMAQLCGLAQAALQSDLHLVATAGLLNDALLRIGEGRFATAILGHIDADAGHVDLIDAGHGLVLWAGADDALHTPPSLSGGPPLGVIDLPYAPCRLPLPPGTRLLLASDGVPELRNPAGEAFGLERLAAAPVGSTPAAQVAAIASAMDAWSGPAAAGDDATVLLLQRR